jgi:hypothetical protein
MFSYRGYAIVWRATKNCFEISQRGEVIETADSVSEGLRKIDEYFASVR